MGKMKTQNNFLGKMREKENLLFFTFLSQLLWCWRYKKWGQNLKFG